MASLYAPSPHPRRAKPSSGTLRAVRLACDPRVGGAGRNANLRLMRRIDQALRALYDAGRRSIAIIDAHCGDGRLLRRVVRRARAMGFVAVEAKGVDAMDARRNQPDEDDPAVGLAFVQPDGTHLPAEDEEADLTLTDATVDPAEARRVTWREGVIVRR